AGEDYIDQSGELTFDPGVKVLPISLQIVDDTAFENDEEFFVDLKSPELLLADGEATSADATGYRVEVGEKATATIVIIDDDLPGPCSASRATRRVMTISPSRIEEPEDFTVNLCVERNNGCTGTVSCKYKTEDSGGMRPRRRGSTTWRWRGRSCSKAA
ncbi:unnamed protein product, partial [Prorocentrum cordatum]